MKTKNSVALFSAMSVALAGMASAAITTGDLVVYRVGTGSAALSSVATAVFLDEYTPTGTLVQSIAMPTAASGSNNPLTASGSASSEGGLSMSGDGRYLLAPGYAAAPGKASVASTNTTTTGGGGPVLRDVARVALDGTIDTSTTTTQFSANNIRSAASGDGSIIYLAGANSGIVALPFGGSGLGTVVSTTITNNRQLAVFSNSLFASDSSGSTNRISLIGTAGSLPTTTGQVATELPGVGIGVSTAVASAVAGPYQFVLTTLDNSATPDVLYVADNGYNSTNGTTTTGAIEKFILVNGTFVADGVAPLINLTGLTGIQSSVGGVTQESLFATTTTGIYSLTDTGPTDTLSGTPNLLVSAPTNTAFRGIVAVPEPTSMAMLALAGVALLSRRQRNQSA